MQFTAMVGGKRITYPESATFVIDQRRPGQAFSLLATKPTIDRALSKFKYAQQPGTITRLCATENGRLIPLMRVRTA
jgi:hypothetical protein